MQENLKKAFIKPLILTGLLLFCFSLAMNKQADYYYYLTAAQLIFVPSLLHMIVKLRSFEKGIIAIGMLAVTLISLDLPYPAAVICAIVYFLVTCWVAWKGFERFLNRGFTNLPEWLIDLGMIYLAIGGGWFLASVSGIDTGFSDMLTWLTAIHFHYSAFMLSVSVGLVGRIQITKLYQICAFVIATGPVTVAIGITFSRTVEIISVSLYVLAIYALTYYLFRLKFHGIQRIIVWIPFLTLCITILWSLAYAYGNLSGQVIVNIPDMLDFHGFLNCLLFGTLTVIGWALKVPESTQQPYKFPVSLIRGRLQKTGSPHSGLVDQMNMYVNPEEVSAQVINFYEHTERFQLFASVKWSAWFRPFAWVWQLISRSIGQLNLPYSSSQVEMTGEIMMVDEKLDGRARPRLWKRMIDEETVFTAIYSHHQSGQDTLMNIALPLPFSSMHGILQLSAENGQLRLTSDGVGDAGTYLAIGKYILKLPLHEYFVIEEKNGELVATHDMNIFGIHFLHIDYVIREFG
ncbi:hypothetical protein KP77_04890 [Jeotgalibacillus alimentarius]|uniref:YndJ-like protein n=1 Tax=Jeotgalibacillus alimentarius TaxID=135826 RepID=A0A0C2WBV9_9BACL|nr:YndJ family protein [Jeotgalibacillus alimentarius]KIL53513.1 hypothetical protein KP77_04890 [Jeotgalibacillus alimentarius]